MGILLNALWRHKLQWCHIWFKLMCVREEYTFYWCIDFVKFFSLICRVAKLFHRLSYVGPVPTYYAAVLLFLNVNWKSTFTLLRVVCLRWLVNTDVRYASFWGDVLTSLDFLTFLMLKLCTLFTPALGNIHANLVFLCFLIFESVGVCVGQTDEQDPWCDSLGRPHNTVATHVCVWFTCTRGGCVKFCLRRISLVAAVVDSLYFVYS